MESNKNELYHYYGGSLNAVDELYHYGVPGMKWGQRKAPVGGGAVGGRLGRLQAKQARMQARRENRFAAGTNKTRKLQAKINVTKSKQALKKAKASGDRKAVKLAKADLKVNKLLAKNGMSGIKGKKNLAAVAGRMGMTAKQAKIARNKSVGRRALATAALMSSGVGVVKLGVDARRTWKLNSAIKKQRKLQAKMKKKK